MYRTLYVPHKDIQFVISPKIVIYKMVPSVLINKTSTFTLSLIKNVSCETASKIFDMFLDFVWPIKSGKFHLI